MAIRFLCFGCSARVKVPEGAQGRKVKCPACGTLQRVPAAEGVPVSSSKSKSKSSSKTRTKDAPADSQEQPAEKISNDALELAFEQDEETTASSKSPEQPPLDPDGSPKEPAHEEPAEEESPALPWTVVKEHAIRADQEEEARLNELSPSSIIESQTEHATASTQQQDEPADESADGPGLFEGDEEADGSSDPLEPQEPWRDNASSSVTDDADEDDDMQDADADADAGVSRDPVHVRTQNTPISPKAIPLGQTGTYRPTHAKPQPVSAHEESDPAEKQAVNRDLAEATLSSHSSSAVVDEFEDEDAEEITEPQPAKAAPASAATRNAAAAAVAATAATTSHSSKTSEPRGMYRPLMVCASILRIASALLLMLTVVQAMSWKQGSLFGLLGTQDYLLVYSLQVGLPLASCLVAWGVAECCSAARELLRRQ